MFGQRPDVRDRVDLLRMHREHNAFIALQDGLRGRVAAHRDIERAVQQPRPHRRFAAVVDRLDLETVLLVEFIDRHVRR